MNSYKLGVDVGSTTVKLVILDENNNIVFNQYQRHFSNIQEALLDIAVSASEKLGNINFSSMITGSGGLSLATWAKIDFIQEVIAVSNAISIYVPETDVAIEIGGEDAKIIYFDNGIEHRMNGICAGGTGSFIDQMASLLQTDAEGLNEMAKDFKVIHPIAARCGVFAKSDIQPLINEGAAKPDLAISVFQAIVSQTISGLACGKPIRGNVAFLGGPLHFISELRNRFIDVLSLEENEVIIPENSHLFAALGSALTAKPEKITSLEALIETLKTQRTVDNEIARLDPLFKNEQEYEEFEKRHSQSSVARKELKDYEGDVFLGIDAGSTTTKLALIGGKGELLYSYYASNEGNPLKVINKVLKEVYEMLPKGVIIRNSCVTGYGESLAKAALNIDIGEIETVAHYKAAAFFKPEVDFILDIGGQDMKCIRIKNGIIDSILLNEACSAGCGSFIETFATSLNLPVSDFAEIAVSGKTPIDLGSRCTVFMNSRVKQAQKEGAEVADISAGLAYSVIKNALQKVIKITDPEQMGKNIVVQGGTFYNKAVLRSFELTSKREAVRPDIAGIMGAFGASLIAKERYKKGYETSLIMPESLKDLEITATASRCKACENNCLLTINKFSGDRKFVSGYRCDRGAGKEDVSKDIPNLFQYKLDKLFEYKPLEPKDAKRGVVGIPRALNMYENYPLWFTFFTKLGYSVQISPKSSRQIYEKGIESMPSESVCYPAKLVHGHIMWLIDNGIKFIFYPSVAYEKQEISHADNHYNCPIVTSYPENIKNNVEEIKTMDIDFRNPFINLNDKNFLIKRMTEVFSDIPPSEVKEAILEGWLEQENFRDDIKRKGQETLENIRKNNIPAVVLAGRPYHIDPEINHGIPELITGFGVAVLSEDSVAHLLKSNIALEVRDQWAYHSRLYAAANLVCTMDNIELLQLNSFGCGLDSISTDEIYEILEGYGKIFTVLKIDEVNNLGSARIRVRSLFAALDERKRKNIVATKAPFTRNKRIIFTKEMRKNHTLLCPQMSPVHFDFIQPALKSCGYNIEVMPAIDRDSIDIGLTYVNNDACYPALIVVGQLLKALKSGKHDLNNTSVLISQTGGGCRATNYISFIRKALKRANMEQIPVVSISGSGLEKNPGIKFTPALINKVIQGMVLGDLFMTVLYRVRPYERVAGSANALCEKWNKKCKKDIVTGNLKLFKENIGNIIKEFDELELLDIKKPRVGIVGEILVKFHPTANNDIVTLLENEGTEVVIPGLTDFFTYGLHNVAYKEKYFGFKKSATIKANLGIKFIDLYRRHMREELEKSKRFEAPKTIYELGNLAEPIVSLGNQTGEGWFLTSEMVELLHSGVNNIACLQPFACLPNHVTGKGIIKELKRRYPKANIVAIDYDPGASEVNQLNRLKLMLAQGFKNMDMDVVKNEAMATDDLGNLAMKINVKIAEA